MKLAIFVRFLRNWNNVAYDYYKKKKKKSSSTAEDLTNKQSLLVPVH